MSDLVRALRAALAAEAGPMGRRGYVCAPFRPREGPLSDHVVKVFRGGRDPEVLEQLGRRHDAYLDCLHQAGLRVPDSRFLILNQADHLQPVVLQRALAPGAFLDQRLTAASRPEAQALIEASVEAVAGFWRNVAQRAERIGLRPDAQTVALDDQGPIYCASFPPLIGYTREDIGRLLLRLSSNAPARLSGIILPERMRARQDPWYGLAGNVLLLVSSCLKQRAQDRAEMSAWAADVIPPRFDGDTRATLSAALSPVRAARPSAWRPALRHVLGQR